MKRHLGEGDALGPERGQQVRVEMQRCRGRGDRPGMAREDGLVVVAVLCVRRAERGDVGRQRHVAGRRQRGVEIGARPVERKLGLPLGDALDTGGKAAPEDDLLALLQLSQRLDQRRPAAAGQRLGQRHLDLRHRFALRRLPGAVPRKPRRDHAGIVQHQPVPRPQQVDQIAHMQVADRVALGEEEPRRRARPRGPRGDQPFGQVEIEIAELHAGLVTSAAWADRPGTGRGTRRG